MDIQFKLNKIIDIWSENPVDFIRIVLGFLFRTLLITIIIVLIAIILSEVTFFIINQYSNDNSTSVDTISFLNQNSSDFVSIFSTSLLTTVLIIFSALSLSSAQDALKQSQKQQKQLQDEQRIRDIERRLELFYMPAQSIMNISDAYIEDPDNRINWVKINDYYQRGYEYPTMPPEERACIYTVEKFEEIEQYRYLAKEKTCRLFARYVYEEESNENRLELSKCIRKDIKDYLVEFNKLKKIDEQIER